jgi:FkbM family methyltransferase
MKPVSTIPTLSDRFLTWWLRRGWRGFHTLRRLRHACGGSQRLRLRTPYGSVFNLDPVAYIDGIVLREGYYESEVFEALRPYLGAGAVFWDIGSNFGLHSITIKLLYPATQVFAFEPNPVMIGEIKAHAQLNGVELDVLPYALADSGGPRIFHVNNQGNAGMSTLHAWSLASYQQQITVECARGDELVATHRLPPPTVIKLDVEGGEADVLTGLGALLTGPELRAVVFEAASGLNQAPDDDPIAGPLRAAGFVFAPLARREHSAHSLDNYLATHTD